MNEFTCEDVVEFMIDFVDGDVTLIIKARIEEHLYICPHCGSRVALYKATLTITRALPKCAPIKLPDEVEARLRQKLNDMMQNMEK